ncbi:DCL family protein [Xanthomonas campestris]|uniref:DCL family protein n=1 Tax=Xanthomonas campestris TaxID=339 RepID=UPI0012902EC0|nr:DCL family protein [Xanthomonas campestris]
MARSVPIQLPNGRHWTKKGDAILHFKSMLGRYAVGARVLDPKDHEDLEALLEVYDRPLTNAADRKAGLGVVYFEKRVDLDHPGRTTCFYVVRRDGTSIDFSYLRALDAAGKSK